MKLHSSKTLIQAQERLASAADKNDDFMRAVEIAEVLKRSLRGHIVQEQVDSRGWQVRIVTPSFSPSAIIDSSRAGEVKVHLNYAGVVSEAKGRNTDVAWDSAVDKFLKNATAYRKIALEEIQTLEDRMSQQEDFLPIIRKI